MSKGYRDAFPVDSANCASTVGRPEFFDSPPAVFPGREICEASHEERSARFRGILERKLHGIAFSPYVGPQRPGIEISEEQILERLQIIAPHTRWIRTFSCIEGNQHTARIASSLGLKTMVGVGLGADFDDNEVELQNGIKVAQEGHADILAIGNEILLREDMSPAQLIEYMERARSEAPGVCISYVDAYFLFENHPEVADACDVLLINCYPFWERCPLEYSLFYMQEMYRRTGAVAKGKKIIISETGWPSSGTPYGSAIPGPEHALTYFLNAAHWVEEAGIDLFYFAAFDEAWKIDDEGDVGAYWGLWDNDGNLKYT